MKSRSVMIPTTRLSRTTGRHGTCFVRMILIASIVGVSGGTMALNLGVDSIYVRRQIEQRLVREGLITITRGGRRLTTKGHDRVVRQSNKDAEGGRHG